MAQFNNMDPLPKQPEQQEKPSNAQQMEAIDRPLMLSDLTKALTIAEEQFEKRFALKDHDHVKYAIKNDLSSLTGDLRQHAINLTDDAKKYTDSLETKLTEKLDELDGNSSVEAIVSWFILGFIIFGTISVFIGLASWYRPFAWIVAGVGLLITAYTLINVFIGRGK